MYENKQYIGTLSWLRAIVYVKFKHSKTPKIQKIVIPFPGYDSDIPWYTV